MTRGGAPNEDPAINSVSTVLDITDRVDYGGEKGLLGLAFHPDFALNSHEEVDIFTPGGNYGWNVMEGNHCYSPSSGCDQTGLILPVAEYDHTQGIAVTGGYVYRGTQIPSLNVRYLYGDYGSGIIRALESDGAGGYCSAWVAPSTKWRRTMQTNSGIRQLQIGYYFDW